MHDYQNTSINSIQRLALHQIYNIRLLTRNDLQLNFVCCLLMQFDYFLPNVSQNQIFRYTLCSGVIVFVIWPFLVHQTIYLLQNDAKSNYKRIYRFWQNQTTDIENLIYPIIKKILIIIKANANNDISERSLNNFSGYAVSHKLIDVNEEKQ